MTSRAGITVLYFAAARTALNLSKEHIDLPHYPYSLSSLAKLLIARHAKTELATVLAVAGWSVNETMVPTDEIDTLLLYGGEEVAIIPPVSGG